MARVPNHPPLLDRAAADVCGKTVTARFTGTRKEAQAILDEVDRRASEAAAKTEERKEPDGDDP
jgi:hypothetical protein